MRYFPLVIALAGAVLTAAPGRGPLSQLPAWFEPAPSGGGYVLRNSEAQLSADGAGVRWSNGGAAVRLRVAGASGQWRWSAGEALPGAASYLLGRDRRQWRQGVARYGELVAREILAGTDFRIYASGGGLEYDFVLAPGTERREIGLQFEGAGSLAVDGRGDLLVEAGGATLRQHAPVAWQEMGDGKKTVVEARWLARGETASIELGEYDRTKELVIDPVISYSGYFGGSLIDRISAVAAAGDGGFWLTGSIRSAVTPVEGADALQAEKKGESDAFLAKVMPRDDTWQLTYFTYIGGTNDDAGEALALKDGFLHIAGQTNSSDWPLAGEAFQNTLKGNFDAFVVKIDTRQAGPESLYYSSYFGGVENDYATAVAVDAQDRIAVAGYTLSQNLEKVVVGTDLQATNRGGVDGFYFGCVTNKPAAEALLSGSFFGGNATDIVTAAAYGPDGLLYLVGVSHSTDLPLNGPGYYSEMQGGGDIFVAAVDPRLRGFDAFLLGTYVGGTGLDVPTAAKFDGQGLLWTAGYTLSRNLPVVVGAHQGENAGRADGFLAAFNPKAGGADFLRYMSYFGGSQDDVIYGLAMGPDGRKTVAGYTYSRDFPQKDNPTPPAGGVRQSDMIVAQIDTNRAGAEALVYSVVYGGPGQDAAFGLALTALGQPFAAGISSSPGLESGGTPAKPNGPGYTTGLFLQLGPAR